MKGISKKRGPKPGTIDETRDPRPGTFIVHRT